jgi:hypothetical protein
MTSIPEGTKFHGVAPFVDTTNKGSATANAMRDAYTIEDIGSAIDTYIIENGITKLIPEFITIGPGTTTVYDSNKNMVDLDWVGASGVHIFQLPPADEIPYRVIRISNNSTVTASDKVHVSTIVPETIDGDPYYVLNKPYNGVAVWSDGTNWTVIQAKST